MLAENLSRPPAALLRALLYQALERAGAGLSIDAVGRLITIRNLARVRSILTAAWVASMPDAREIADSPSPPKKQTWLDAWATARDDLGLSSEEWLEMTPRMAKALDACRLERIRQREFMASRAIAMSANFGFCAPKKPFDHAQFMLHPWPSVGEEPREITGELISAVMATAYRGVAKG